MGYRWRKCWHYLPLAAIVLMLIGHPRQLPAQPVPTSPSQRAPIAKKHPLPPSLDQWQDLGQRGDYFSQIKASKAGYLIWSQFPVQVYVGPATATLPNAEQIWRPAVIQAIQDWQSYLPLALTADPKAADIEIVQQSPRTVGRVRSAETRYQIYIDEQQRLRHHSSIKVRPNQTSSYITAAVRHELGHALGLWGHSPNPEDVLYFAQVRNPPPISVRDINTLKRVYEQPTRLGWPLPPNGTDN